MCAVAVCMDILKSEVIRYFYYILTVFWSSLNENWWCCAEKKYCKRKCRVTFCPDEMSVDTKFTPILLNWNPSNYCYQVQNMVHKSLWWHGSIAVVRQCTYGLWETLSTVTWCEDTCGEDLVQRNTKWWKWLKSEALMNREISQKCRWNEKDINFAYCDVQQQQQLSINGRSRRGLEKTAKKRNSENMTRDLRPAMKMEYGVW